MRRIVSLIGVLTVFSFLTACTLSASRNLNIQTSSSNNVNVVSTTSVAGNINAKINTNSATVNNVNSPIVELTTPLDRPSERIIKKFFGTYVTPQNSPVQPERFTGYHTGIDFETFPSETNIDVSVSAACTGKVRAVQYVSGYGGVLVQQCVVAGQTVTALYGHLRLASITVKVGTTLNAETKFAVLGKGYSTETDGERKHLHFSLHKGTAIVWKGYVSAKSALNGWLDPLMYLPKT